MEVLRFYVILLPLHKAVNTAVSPKDHAFTSCYTTNCCEQSYMNHSHAPRFTSCLPKTISSFVLDVINELLFVALRLVRYCSRSWWQKVPLLLKWYYRLGTVINCYLVQKKAS